MLLRAVHFVLSGFLVCVEELVAIKILTWSMPVVPAVVWGTNISLDSTISEEDGVRTALAYGQEAPLRPRSTLGRTCTHGRVICWWCQQVSTKKTNHK